MSTCLNVFTIFARDQGPCTHNRIHQTFDTEQMKYFEQRTGNANDLIVRGGQFVVDTGAPTSFKCLRAGRSLRHGIKVFSCAQSSRIDR